MGIHPLGGSLLAALICTCGIVLLGENDDHLSVQLVGAVEGRDNSDAENTAFAAASAELFQASTSSMNPLTTEQTRVPDVADVGADLQLIDQSEVWRLGQAHTQVSGNRIAVPDTAGPGLCALDINGDTFLDVVLLNGVGDAQFYGKRAWWREKPEVSILLNTGRGSFAETTIDSIAEIQAVKTCAVADVDSDGLADLIFGTATGITFFINDGKGDFVERGLFEFDRSGIVTSGIWPGDFDNDGLVDLYVTNYIVFDKTLNTFEAQFGYKPMQSPDNNPVLYDSYKNFLFHNAGSLEFAEVSSEQGVANLGGRSLSAKWVDVDQDSDLDLLVMNDSPSPSEVYLNQAGAGFVKPVTREYDALRRAGLRAVGFVGSEPAGVYLSNAMGNRGALFERAVHSGPFRQSTKNSTENFGELSSWAVSVTDFNNDGYSDLYVSNGTRFENQESHHTTYGQPNDLYIGTPTGQYQRINQVAAPGESTSSRSLIAADFNHDGSVEVLVGNNNGDFQLFEQRQYSRGNWLNLYFTRERQIINESELVLTVENGTHKRTYRFNDSRSYMSQVAGELHVGLGPMEGPLDLEIIAGSGWSTTLQKIPVNKNVLVDARSNNYTVLTDSHSDAVAIGAIGVLSFEEMSEQELLAIADNIFLDGRYSEIESSLERLWQVDSKRVRFRILENMLEAYSEKYKKIMPLAMHSSQPDVRHMAIEVVKKHLPQDSFLWAVGMVRSESVDISCAGSEMLYSWYEEEEFFPLIKRELVVELIRLHDTVDDERRKNCLLKTLAATKSKRVFQLFSDIAEKNGVTPLLIWAMGRLGDPLAVEVIERALKSRMSEPDLGAAALVALSRLNNEIADAYLLDNACDMQGIDRENVLSCAEWVSALYDAQDSLVLDQEYLSEQARNVLAQAEVHWNTYSQTDQLILIRKVAQLSVGNDSLYLPATMERWFVEHIGYLLNHDSVFVFNVVKKFDSLIYLEREILKRTEREQFALIKHQLESDSSIGSATLNEMPFSLDHEATLRSKPGALPGGQDENRGALLLDKRGSKSAMNEAFESTACPNHEVVGRRLHPTVLSTHDFDEILLLLECSRAADLRYASVFDTLDMVQVVRFYRDIRRDKNRTEDEKMRVLLTLSSYFKPVAERYLPSKMSLMREDNLIEAISILRQHTIGGVGEKIIATVRKLASASRLTRLESINYLLSIGDEVPEGFYDSRIAI